MIVRPWTVTLSPVDEHDEIGQGRGRPKAQRNVSGIAVEITDGDESVEVSRVAFVRRNSLNPETDFGDQLAAEIDKAERAAALVNEYLDERERVFEERHLEVQDKVRELIGEPQGVPA